MLERWMHQDPFEEEHRELLARAEEYDADTAGAEDDHRLLGSPLMAAWMRCDGEAVAISAYASPRMLVITYPRFQQAGEWKPGLVKERPIGLRQELGEVFARAVMEHEASGWKHAGSPA